jgi:stage V sporulation protein G
VDISEVRIKLMPEHATKKDKLQAFCSITIGNDFVVRDIKIIEGSKGIFVAMPSRKLTDRCVRCSAKNHLRAKFCNDCGQKLPPERAGRDVRGRAKLHADIAHPINVHCREAVQAIILGAYKQEMKRSQLPGYVPQELHALPELDEIAEGFMEE